MPTTIEVDRRSQRRYDTGLASTYQLDHVRRDYGFRAMVVASYEGEMLLGSMDEPIGRALALAVGAVGTNALNADDMVIALRDNQLAGDRTADLHVLEMDLDGIPTYLGILAERGRPIEGAFERVETGIKRIFATT